jgi:hypothetical protein
MFGSGVQGYLLGIRGHDCESFAEELSPAARRNLAAAADFIGPVLRERDFECAVTAHGPGPIQPVTGKETADNDE